MENIFMKVYFYVNLAGKKINDKNEKIMKEIIADLKIKAQAQIDERLENDNRKGE